MRVEAFFEKFEVLAEAPGGVGRLRELVLELAVRGRLVPQDSEDEPAGSLLIRITNDRAAFVEQHGVSRQRTLEQVSEGEWPIALPHGWLWTRLGNLCRVQAGYAFPSAAFVQDAAGVPIIRIRDISTDRTQANYVGDYRDEFLVDTGDYLVGMDGNFTVARWHGPQGLLNQRVSRLQWYSQCVEPLFFAIAAQQRLFDLQGKKAYTTVDHLSTRQIENVVVPLPPLAEQRRIVAKVDELMALCDQLEAQQREREERKTVLVRAALGRFEDAPTPANLQLVFHRSYDVSPAELRKAILALAVQGKLVAQDPNDEPVANSLPRLAERAVEPVDSLFPSHWLLVPLGNVGEWRGGGTPSKARSDYWTGDIPWVSPKDMKTLLIADAKDRISLDAVRDSAVRRIPEGSILMVVRGMILARAFPVALTASEVTINQDMKAVLPIEPESASFLLLALRAMHDVVLAGVERSSHGTCKLRTEVLEAIAVGFPPLAEQRRIVAKVDELMALVDALEAQLAAARTTGATLLDAVLAELTAA